MADTASPLALLLRLADTTEAAILALRRGDTASLDTLQAQRAVMCRQLSDVLRAGRPWPRALADALVREAASLARLEQCLQDLLHEHGLAGASRAA